MRIGVDLGGTKIEVIALDDGGSTLLRRRVPTPVGDYDGTLNAVADLVLSAEKELGTAGTVGVATSRMFLLTVGGLAASQNAGVLNTLHARDDVRPDKRRTTPSPRARTPNSWRCIDL